jgi:hypothetical protein
MPDPPTFTSAEWDLLVRLPGQVVIAATSTESDNPRLTVAEGLAGIDAIAAGRVSENPLVRSVVGTIYAELVQDAATAEEFSDRARGIAGVLTSSRRVAAVLGDRCAAGDREAYRQWVKSIAERVCQASRSGGVLGIGGATVSVDERRFLADLSGALGG